jgi:hypothetical protein
VSSAWRYRSLVVEMERRFFVEVKHFVFSVLEGELVAQLEERRRNYAGSMMLGAQCINLVVSTMEAVLRNSEVKTFF